MISSVELAAELDLRRFLGNPVGTDGDELDLVSPLGRLLGAELAVPCEHPGVRVQLLILNEPPEILAASVELEGHGSRVPQIEADLRLVLAAVAVRRERVRRRLEVRDARGLAADASISGARHGGLGPDLARVLVSLVVVLGRTSTRAS